MIYFELVLSIYEVRFVIHVFIYDEPIALAWFVENIIFFLLNKLGMLFPNQLTMSIWVISRFSILSSWSVFLF